MLFGKYKKIKKDYLNRSPRGKWEFVRNIGIFILKISGVPVLDPNWKISWYSYVPNVVYIDLLLSFIYTVWYHSDTPLNGFLIIPTYAVILPVNQYLIDLIFQMSN